MGDALVLGPLLRFVDETCATVWVETARAARVSVNARWTAGTFAVHGHHYALVEVTGLEPGTRTPYTVEVDGEQVWPEAGSVFPQPAIPTLSPERPLRLMYGSCRTSVSHDEAGDRLHGVDALRAYALRMAGRTDPGDEPPRWPDLALFLGDQVYADETTDEMRSFIAARRDPDEPPGTELADYQEYAHLYRLAWTDPANRWLLSTLPTAMIFDDHDVRDDWNTSAVWRAQMARTPWWHGRIVAALASYWVYQHLGNLSPDELAEDEIWRAVHAYDGPGEPDVSEVLDRFAERVDEDPEEYRWSFSRTVGGSRLVVVDSRAARALDGGRAMLDAAELRWLDGELRGDCRHLLVATSLPFLLPPGLHHLEAFDEAVAEGAFGRRLSGAGERLRQGADLEHWAAFHHSFLAVAEMVLQVASGRRGRPPGTVTFLSGDVHHSYLSEVDRIRAGRPKLSSRVLQAVCSPIRNPLPTPMRVVTTGLAHGLGGSLGRALSRSAGVASPPFRWSCAAGPWFGNSIATVEERGTALLLSWDSALVTDGDHERPALRRVARVHVGPGDATTR